MLKKHLITTAILVLAMKAGWAVPMLQLDIDNGVYVGGSEESTITYSDTFKLQALLTGQNAQHPADLSKNYYISIALTPKTTPPGGSYGTISFAGLTLDVTGDMVYGTPPVDSAYPDIGGHGIYDTYYYEYAFKFSALNTVPTYNVESGLSEPGTSYIKEFDVDVSGLAAGYNIHFDLYTYYLDQQGRKIIGKTDFAPFSHDAGTDRKEKVPDGGTTVALLGLTLVGFEAIRRRFIATKGSVA